MGKKSIVFDVKMCLKEIDRIGESKREARNRGESGMIHSLKQKEHTMSASQNFVKWVRSQYGIKRLYEVTEQHYVAYLGYLEMKGTTSGHRRNVETALRHLQNGLNARLNRFGREEVYFVPDKRVTKYERPFVKNRAYSDEEYHELLLNLSESVRDAVMLMRVLGLRVKEAANIRVEHFKFNNGWVLHIDKGSGVTKGGRFRSLTVPIHFYKDLERMIEGKNLNETLVEVKVDTIRKAVNRGLKKAGINQEGRGCHGFRHAYARERLIHLMKEKKIEGAMEMLQRILENRENGKLADYGVFTPKDKALFFAVREVVNQVHSDIGHGEDRWDLAMVYMKD